MKKQLLTSAVAAAIVLPTLAQAGVYGRVDGVVRYNDTSASAVVGGVSAGSASRDAWDVGSEKMRWGIVGSEDLGNGMKALYRYEFAMNTDNQGNGSTQAMERTRLAYVGLQGNWGKLTVGRNWIQSYGAVWKMTDTGDAHGTGSGDNNLSGNRSGNMVQYTTPSMSGFTVGLDLNIDDNDTNQQNSDGVDWYEVVANYENGPMQIGFAYRDAELGATNCVGTACVEYDQWGIGGSYSFGDLKIEANYGNRDTDGATSVTIGSGTLTTAITGINNVDTDAWGIGATYKMGNTQLHGAYRSNDADWTGPGVAVNADTSDWYIGVRHKMSKETRVFAEYRQTETDLSTTGASADLEEDMFAFGLRKDWKL